MSPCRKIMVEMTEEEKIKLVSDCFYYNKNTEPKILYLWCELNFNQISKNRQHKIAGNRLVNVNTPFMKKLIEEISIESKIQKIEWEKTKTWIFLHITKKINKGDPINTIDVLCDCIKQGIGIDDIEYSLIIDSHIDPTATPKIEYWIIQTDPNEIKQLIKAFLERCQRPTNKLVGL